jgi:deoxyribonuclease-4
VGHWLGAKRVVFHPGFYGKDLREEAFFQIKERIKEMQEEIERKKWDVKLCPEIMGKVNVFGNVDEIYRLVKEIGCGFCIDFAHVLAREKKIDIKKLEKLFVQKHWHCHFSGIEYGEKGEKHHRKTSENDWKKLLEILPKNKVITIINESPSPFEDTVLGLRIWKSLE